MFLLSGNVSVFPCSNRNPAKDSNSRLMTEFNIASIINRFVDRDSFVVSCNIPANLTGDITEIILNIHGYYFRIGKLSIGDDLKDVVQTEINKETGEGSYVYTLYAKIKLASQGGYTELAPLKTEVSKSAGTNSGTQQTVGDLDVEESVDGKQQVDFYGLSLECAKVAPSAGVGEYILSVLTIGVNVKADKTFTYESIEVPQDSYIKFVTDDSRKSISIDDGII